MSGELTLEKSGWPRLAATVAAVCALDAALMVFLLPHLHLTGMAQAVVCALTAYLLFRLLYPAISALLPGGQQSVSWSGAAPGRPDRGPGHHQNGPLLAGAGCLGQPPERLYGEHRDRGEKFPAALPGGGAGRGEVRRPAAGAGVGPGIRPSVAGGIGGSVCRTFNNWTAMSPS